MKYALAYIAAALVCFYAMSQIRPVEHSYNAFMSAVWPVTILAAVTYGNDLR